MLVWRNGRRTGLKIPRGQLHVGSTPTTSTKAKKVEKEAFFFLFEFERGRTGAKGNCVCVCPPRRDSGTTIEALLTAERPPPPAPTLKQNTLTMQVE